MKGVFNMTLLDVYKVFDDDIVIKFYRSIGERYSTIKPYGALTVNMIPDNLINRSVLKLWPESSTCLGVVIENYPMYNEEI